MKSHWIKYWLSFFIRFSDVVFGVLFTFYSKIFSSLMMFMVTFWLFFPALEGCQQQNNYIKLAECVPFRLVCWLLNFRAVSNDFLRHLTKCKTLLISELYFIYFLPLILFFFHFSLQAVENFQLFEWILPDTQNPRETDDMTSLI